MLGTCPQPTGAQGSFRNTGPAEVPVSRGDGSRRWRRILLEMKVGRLVAAACLAISGFSTALACGGPMGTSTTIPNSQRPHITTTINGTLTTVVTGP